jgi:hypothetical protein
MGWAGSWASEITASMLRRSHDSPLFQTIRIVV